MITARGNVDYGRENVGYGPGNSDYSMGKGDYNWGNDLNTRGSGDYNRGNDLNTRGNGDYRRGNGGYSQGNELTSRGNDLTSRGVLGFLGVSSTGRVDGPRSAADRPFLLHISAAAGICFPERPRRRSRCGKNRIVLATCGRSRCGRNGVRWQSSNPVVSAACASLRQSSTFCYHYRP